jgi:hypothetical protein
MRNRRKEKRLAQLFLLKGYFLFSFHTNICERLFFDNLHSPSHQPIGGVEPLSLGETKAFDLDAIDKANKVVQFPQGDGIPVLAVHLLEHRC